jgi:hypothetical protein
VGAGYIIGGNVIRRNIVRGDDITVIGESYQNTVESNQVETGSIVFSGEGPISWNAVRYNVVRGGHPDEHRLSQLLPGPRYP